jgi:hypothetical protein
MNASTLIERWPQESREAAQLVIESRGEPDEATESQLIWHDAKPFKRIVASREFYEHNFPAPHIDAVESVVTYRVPVDKVESVLEFDGSVIVERTAGEVSARCHDEQANYLALNLMYDIVMGKRDKDEARAYYGKEFLDFRRGKPTPYMQSLRFVPSSGSADPDERALSEDQLRDAEREGQDGG